jgi:anti-anti-sigma regulatory factor
MLRITTVEGHRSITLVFEGSLGGEWVLEAIRVWEHVLQSARRRNIIVDLRAVSYVSQSGRELLAAMHRAGTKLRGSGTLIGGLVRDIVQESSRAEKTWAIPGGSDD